MIVTAGLLSDVRSAHSFVFCSHRMFLKTWNPVSSLFLEKKFTGAQDKTSYV